MAHRRGRRGGTGRPACGPDAARGCLPFPARTLAADAVANARAGASSGPPPKAGRVAVAMSGGGVDSAVALLLPRALVAVGVTLRLWLDPRAVERRACRPRTRSSAPGRRPMPSGCRTSRSTSARSSAPPSSSLSSTGTPPGSPRNHDALQPAASLDHWSTSCTVRERTSSGQVTTRGSSSAAAGGSSRAPRIRRKIKSYMFATVDPATPSIRVPVRGESRPRCGTSRRGRARRRAPCQSQEACFLAGGDDRSFLERNGVKSARARSSTATPRSSTAQRHLAFRGRRAARRRRRRRRAALRAPHGPGCEHARGRPARGTPHPASRAEAPSLHRHTRGRKAALPLAIVARRPSPPTTASS